MEGARLIHSENYRLTMPAKVVEASEVYRAENDWFSHFLTDQCVLEDGSEVKAGELYQAYRAWALSTSGWVRPMVDFNAACEGAGFVRKKTRAGIKVYGLRLKDEFEQ